MENNQPVTDFCRSLGLFAAKVEYLASGASSIAHEVDGNYVALQFFRSDPSRIEAIARRSEFVYGKMREHGLTAPRILGFDAQKGFLVMDKIRGITAKQLLQANPGDGALASDLYTSIGRYAQSFHTIGGEGYGIIRDGRGESSGPWSADVLASFENSVRTLYDLEVISASQKTRLVETLSSHVGLLHCETPLLLHGDLQRGNILVDFNTLEVTALIDVEEAQFGDPLSDVGYFLANTTLENRGFFDGRLHESKTNRSHSRNDFLRGYGKEDENTVKKVALYELASVVPILEFIVGRKFAAQNQAHKQKRVAQGLAGVIGECLSDIR